MTDIVEDLRRAEIRIHPVGTRIRLINNASIEFAGGRVAGDQAVILEQHLYDRGSNKPCSYQLRFDDGRESRFWAGFCELVSKPVNFDVSKSPRRKITL